jgi:hypothetical protein
MAAKNVDIKINTTASGNGAKQAEDGLKKVGAESEKASKKRISAEERAAIKAEQAAKRAADAAIREEKRKTAAAEAEAAKRIKAEERAATQTAQAAGKAAGKRSQVASQVGFQVQDIAVQAQMGVQATTILAQQGSQLLGAFGPTGAIIGGILAIGAAATGVFMKMGDDTASAREKAEFLAEAVNKIKENAAKLQSEDIDYGSEAITKSILLAQILRDTTDSVTAAEKRYSEQALANAEKLRLAQVEIQRLKGEQVDENAEAIKQEEFQLSQIEAKAQAEVDAQKAKLQAAEQEKKDAQDLLDQRANAIIQNEQLLATLQSQLEVIKAQKSELEKTSKETTIDERQSIRSGFPIFKPSDAASAAQQTLSSTPFDAQIAQLEGKIDKLVSATEIGTGKLYEELLSAAEQLNIANQALPQVAQEVAVQAQAIVEAADTEAISSAVKNRVKEAEANAQAVNAEIANFVPVNEIQAQAIAEIKKRTSDLQITADETAIVAQNLQTIRTSLVQGQQLNVSATDSIIKSLESYNKRLKELERRAKALPTGAVK